MSLSDDLRAEAGGAKGKTKELLDAAAARIDELTAPTPDPAVEAKRFQDAWDTFTEANRLRDEKK